MIKVKRDYTKLKSDWLLWVTAHYTSLQLFKLIYEISKHILAPHQ